MGFAHLNSSSALFCQDDHCREHFPNHSALVPKLGKSSGSLEGKAFIVVSPITVFGVLQWLSHRGGRQYIPCRGTVSLSFVIVWK